MPKLTWITSHFSPAGSQSSISRRPFRVAPPFSGMRCTLAMPSRKPLTGSVYPIETESPTNSTLGRPGRSATGQREGPFPAQLSAVVDAGAEVPSANAAFAKPAPNSRQRMMRFIEIDLELNILVGRQDLVLAAG